jgi:hypothetical protein
MVITVASEKSEEVGLHEAGAAGDAFLFGVALGECDHARVVLDAHGARAAFCGGDDGAAVAGAEVDDVVLGRHLGHVEHLVDEGLRRGHPDDVFPFLADLRLVGGRRGFLRLGKREGRGQGKE